MEEKVILNNEEKVDNNLKDIIKNVNKNRELTKEEINKILEESKDSINFLKRLDELDVRNEKFRVIFTDGEEQLVYEDGEFFVISTTDISKIKKKKKKSEARDMYLEYFIKYQLNPILNQVKLNTMVKTISRKHIENPSEIKEIKKRSNLSKSLKDSIEKDTQKKKTNKKVEKEIVKNKEKKEKKSKEKTIER